MSKLDDIITNSIGKVPKDNFNDFQYIKIAGRDIKQQIKALMLETANKAGLLGHDYAAFEDEVNEL